MSDLHCRQASAYTRANSRVVERHPDEYAAALDEQREPWWSDRRSWARAVVRDDHRDEFERFYDEELAARGIERREVNGQVRLVDMRTSDE